MFYLKYLTIILVITLVLFLIQLSNAKKYRKMSDDLLITFDKWLKSNGDSEKPSNAQFSKLFFMKYDKEHSYRKIPSPKGWTTIDFVNSFPSTNNQLIVDEFVFLENLKDHFEFEYKEIFTFNHWLNTLIFLPSNFLSYIGFNEDSVASKLVNVLYWLLSLMAISWKPFLSDLINSIF